MSVLDLFKRSAAPVALSAGLAFASTAALGAQVGECGPSKQIIDKLKAEGQFSLIVAEKWTENKNSRPFIGFFTNNDGSRGYMIEGDKGPGMRIPEQACIKHAFANVKLNNSQTVPPSFLLKTSWSKEAIQKECERQTLRSCGSYNHTLEIGAKNGLFPVFQAQKVLVGPDNSITSWGQLVTVSNSNDGSGGPLEVTFDGGLSQLSYHLDNIQFTKTGEAAVNAKAPFVVAYR